MPDIIIRGLTNEEHQTLKERAAARGRSMSGEAKAALLRTDRARFAPEAEQLEALTVPDEGETRYRKHIVVSLEPDDDRDAADLAMAIWYTAAASRLAGSLTVQPVGFEMPPEYDWDGPEYETRVVSKPTT